MKKQEIIEDTLLITAINKDKKVFERVSRISGITSTLKLTVELDVNTEIYPIEKDRNYALVLATSLTPDLNEDFDLFRYGPSG